MPITARASQDKLAKDQGTSYTFNKAAAQMSRFRTRSGRVLHGISSVIVIDQVQQEDQKANRLRGGTHV